MSHSLSLKLAKSDFKFSAAHFLIFDADRAERLHGHNYQVRVCLGIEETGELGMHKDFSVYKKRIREIISEWDEYVLLPRENREFSIKTLQEQLELKFRDRFYSFPISEVKLLPIKNTSVEELARLLTEKFIAEFSSSGLQFVEFEVEETQGQSACFRHQF